MIASLHVLKTLHDNFIFNTIENAKIPTFMLYRTMFSFCFSSFWTSNHNRDKMRKSQFFLKAHSKKKINTKKLKINK